MRRVHLGPLVRLIIVLVVVGLAVFPIYWMFVTSLTRDGDLFSGAPQLLPISRCSGCTRRL